MSCRFSFTMKVIVERVEQRVVFSAVDREVLTGNVASLLRKYYFLIRFQPFLPPCFTILSAIHWRFLLCASLLNLVNASKMLRGSGNGEGHVWEMFLGTGGRERERDDSVRNCVTYLSWQKKLYLWIVFWQLDETL